MKFNVNYVMELVDARLLAVTPQHHPQLDVAGNYCIIRVIEMDVKTVSPSYTGIVVYRSAQCPLGLGETLIRPGSPFPEKGVAVWKAKDRQLTLINLSDYLARLNKVKTTNPEVLRPIRRFADAIKLNRSHFYIEAEKDEYEI